MIANDQFILGPPLVKEKKKGRKMGRDNENWEAQAIMGGLEIRVCDLVQLAIWLVVPEGVGVHKYRLE